MAMALTSEPPMEIEGCLGCSAVWMDAPTFESLTGGVVETTNSLAMNSTEIYAEIKLKELKDREWEEEEKVRKKKKRIRRL
jgi:Zn-finger nucleic acid-binding protein